MANVEVVVKIPYEAYKLLKDEGLDWLGAEHILNAVANGKPLPKGHGKLKDTDAIIDAGFSKRFCDWYDEIKYADTIIEADKEVEE